jgi:50S ribosomal protein L16 3-hydroxylase
MKSTLLGGLTPREFLARHWEKKPLLVRQAIPGFAGLIDREELFALACRDDVEARLIANDDGCWQVRRSPLARREITRRRSHPWTVLVQGVNLYSPRADALLRIFDFVPFARLDDLMISYAVDGGGVGPHFDSYDVFLLQATGRRKWQIGAQRDLTLLEGVPLKILRNFKPSREWILEPGDMLYLPPHYAHNGIAVGECTTYSIGFRAPSAQELVTQFLIYLQDRVDVPGMYRDPELSPPEHPGELGHAMVRKAMAMLDKVSWNRETVADFLGCYLTEPKPHVFFSVPANPLSLRQFARRCRQDGFALDARSGMLFSGTRFFMNGEPVDVPAGDRQFLRRLADRRVLQSTETMSEAGLELLYGWYLCGFGMPAASHVG